MNDKSNGTAMLNEETRKTIDHWVAKFPEDKKRSALIQSLIAAQEQNGGWITEELTEAVAGYLGLPSVWAHEVVSFYSMFFTEPVGRHKVNMCTNISCWLNGADELVAHAEKKLGVKLGGTTGDPEDSVYKKGMVGSTLQRVAKAAPCPTASCWATATPSTR